MRMPKIASVHARQILDSRGNPTVEVDVALDDGAAGRASIPSGASTGTHEAVELRDQDQSTYLGKGVLRAVEHVNTEIADFLRNNDPDDQEMIDSEMILRDGTRDAGRLGANAILGVSLAVSKAVAASRKLPYYRYVRELYERVSGSHLTTWSLPRPMFNVLNGGAHTDWQTTDIQEFMIIPLRSGTFAEQLRWGAEIYHHLEKILEKQGYGTTVGDEGGFAPKVKNDEEALQLLHMAVEAAGYQPGKDVAFGLDAATSAMFHPDREKPYHLSVQKKDFSTSELVEQWVEWTSKYPIISLEDGLAEDDWAGWTQLANRLGNGLQLVGDDLLVTNLERIHKAAELKACNSLLMKVNQIGTLTESLQAIAAAKDQGWTVVVSHRSGETEDSSIADIVVGTQAGQIKAGAPARSERLAKYNQLLRIEEELMK